MSQYDLLTKAHGKVWAKFDKRRIKRPRRHELSRQLIFDFLLKEEQPFTCRELAKEFLDTDDKKARIRVNSLLYNLRKDGKVVHVYNYFMVDPKWKEGNKK